MLNKRLEKAGSLGTVHTHTHTHHILTNRIGGQSGELHFSEIKYSFIKHRLEEDSSKSLF